MSKASAASKQAALVAVAVAGNQLREAVVQNVSVPPIGGSAATHYEALELLDHPYARRHGRINIQITGAGFPGFAKNKSLVHTPTGRLRSAITGRLTTAASGTRGRDPVTGRFTASKGASPSYEVSVDTSRAPYAVFVIRGTRVMLPRDVLADTLFDRAVSTMLLRTVTRIFGQTFRTQSGLRLE